MRETGFHNPEGISPFEYTFEKHLWTYLGENPKLQKDMMDYMTGRRGGGMRWLDIYPIASQLESNTKSREDVILLVDIGGNQGHDLKLFKSRQPNLAGRLILMDLPEVVNKIADPLEGIEVVSYDFFTPQPIKGMFGSRASFLQ
jgi:hypothetical protein